MDDSRLLAAIDRAFASEVRGVPPMSLRAGDAVDDYAAPPAFDPARDAPTAAYLEAHHHGVPHLDAASWRHYLHLLMRYALAAHNPDARVVDALLESLRPPDREPPRLESLTAAQANAIVAFLERLAFGPACAAQALACQVLEEGWLPDATYRPYPAPGASSGRDDPPAR